MKYTIVPNSLKYAELYAIDNEFPDEISVTTCTDVDLVCLLYGPFTENQIESAVEDVIAMLDEAEASGNSVDVSDIIADEDIGLEHHVVCQWDDDLKCYQLNKLFALMTASHLGADLGLIEYLNFPSSVLM